MTRLNTLKPAISKMAPRLSASAHRHSAEVGGDWSKLYDLRAWRGKPYGLRWQTLVRDMFTCQMCGQVISDDSKAHADHIEPHRGSKALFFDPANVQTLCEGCHNSVKQSQERGGRMSRRDGWRP